MGALHIVVVGAGALGLSSALHLAERGVAVTVMVADATAGGSSGRSLGVIGRSPPDRISGGNAGLSAR